VLNLDATLQPHPDVVFTELQSGESVLLHLDTKTYFSLNETGSTIWSLLEGGRSLTEVADALTEQYDVSRDQASASVLALVQQLLDENLVSLTDTPAAARVK
jgi:hypothetical protein